MQIALLSCYEALIDGLTKASNNASALANLGWGKVQYDVLQQQLGAIRAAEEALFNASVTLNDRLAAAQASLTTLSPLLVAVGAGAPEPLAESSLRYSTSMSSSSSAGWFYPSGGVWVTDSSSYRLPNGCPSGSGSGTSTASSLAKGAGPGKFALGAVKKAAKQAPPKKAAKKGR